MFASVALELRVVGDDQEGGEHLPCCKGATGTRARRTAAGGWPRPTAPIPAICADVDGVRHPLSLHLLPEALARVRAEIVDAVMNGGPTLKFYEAW